MRPIGIKCELSESQEEHRRQRKLSVLPLTIQLLEETNEDVLFIDEAVFSCGQVKASTWMATQQKILMPKKLAGFPCIAVVAAIN